MGRMGAVNGLHGWGGLRLLVSLAGFTARTTGGRGSSTASAWMGVVNSWGGGGSFVSRAGRTARTGDRGSSNVSASSHTCSLDMRLLTLEVREVSENDAGRGFSNGTGILAGLTATTSAMVTVTVTTPGGELWFTVEEPSECSGGTTSSVRDLRRVVPATAAAVALRLSTMPDTTS
jgi:hypothetical protein